MSEARDLAPAFSSYESGKHRRYNLLFAVNGGAFTVAKLFAESSDRNVLGNLTLRQLSLGLVLFTIVMVADIFVFGERMKEYYSEAFGPWGKAVLVSIGALLSSGWILVAF